MAAEAEPMQIDTADANQKKRRPQKRKRIESCLLPASPEETQVRIDEFRNEIDSLVRFGKELVMENRESVLESAVKVSLNASIACMMEESDLPLSKLVDDIYEKVKGSGNGQSVVTQAMVKSTVLMVGQRLCYGAANADADVLEDDVQSALWCWETRDLKLIPKLERISVKVRRTVRKKIQERISVVVAMISTLGKSVDHENFLPEITKASEKLVKVLTEADIRVLLQNMLQKNGAGMAEKEAKKEEKLLIRQMEKNKREMEKEKKKMDRELQKEKLQSEKEQKRLHDEAEKEQRRREKEEQEIQKQLKKEAEKDLRRKEKEEAEMRKQLAVKKQASLMERFLKRNISACTSQHDNSTKKAAESPSSVVQGKPESVTQAMDSMLAENCGVEAETLWKSHLNSWRSMRSSTHPGRKVHWGARQKPKTELVKKIKLTTSKEQSCDEDSSIEQLVDGWVDPNSDKSSSPTNVDRPISNGHKQTRCKQLLQFDKSHRPAFYGVWPRKSKVVRPRNPFAKDPDVDYEIDSDEEWEEDEPGESLSDCDKDEEDEGLETNLKGDDEDESEDGFFVPDGYLSENEGAHADDMESDELVEELNDRPDSGDLVQSEEFRTLLRQQKYLNNLTEHALKKNQPLIISNLMHDKTTSLSADDVTGIEKLERLCLQTLCIRPLPGFICIEILNDDNVIDEGTEASLNKSNTAPLAATAPTLLDSDLPQIVSIIQSCPHNIGKIVESLQNNFSTISKSQLKNKVREISEFSPPDNRWQVKKEILSKLGLSISPDRTAAKPKTIATFFKKRCLPPAGKNMTVSETSPELSEKSSAVTQTTQDRSIL